MIDDALRQIERFRGRSLAETIANIEARLAGAASKDVAAVNTTGKVAAKPSERRHSSRITSSWSVTSRRERSTSTF